MAITKFNFLCTKWHKKPALGFERTFCWIGHFIFYCISKGIYYIYGSCEIFYCTWVAFLLWLKSRTRSFNSNWLNCRGPLWSDKKDYKIFKASLNFYQHFLTLGQYPDLRMKEIIQTQELEVHRDAEYVEMLGTQEYKIPFFLDNFFYK